MADLPVGSEQNLVFKPFTAPDGSTWVWKGSEIGYVQLANADDIFDQILASSSSIFNI